MKRAYIAAGVGTLAFGGSLAFAASLGGIDSDNLGSSTSVVASCDTDGIDVSYTTEYDATEAQFDVVSVTLSDVAPGCEGEAIDVTLADDTNAEIGKTVAHTAGATGTETINLDTTAYTSTHAEDVELVAVVISGTP